MTTTATMCVNDGGLINPDAFPVRGGDLDLGAITGAAAGVRAMATSVHDETSSISSTWTGLSAGYEAPEQQQVYDLMNPAVTASDELKSAFDSMGGHLDTYASTLEGIKTRLEDFETKAADFRAEVINGVEVIAAEGNDANVGDYAAWAFQWVPGVEQRTTTVPWDQDTATWERNEALLEEYAGLLAEVSAAAAQCANDINALLTNSCVPYVEAIPAEAFTDPMNIATLGGIAEAIAVNGSALLLLTENYDGPSNLRTAPLDAVVLIGCSTRLVDAVHVFTQRGVPIVGIETEPMDGVVRVDIDNRGGTAVLAGHLRDLGHEDVVLVTLALDADHTTGWITPDREAASEGYTASQRILGARDVFPESRAYSASTSSVDDGYRAGVAVLAESTPTAIIAQSDLLAIGVIRAATEAGLRVPEDLSVVGFDGIRLDGIAPHDLTTMVQPAFDKGLSAGRAVVDLVEGLEPEPAWFDSEFHRGTTTAPPRR